MARGGNAANIIIDASNTPGEFDKRIVVLDNDKGKAEMVQARQEAARRDVCLIENSPCLEATLLAVLNDGKNYSDKQSGWCKEQFQEKYLDKKKRTELCEYEKIFPKILLDKQRSKVSELGKIISIMEGRISQD